MKLGSTLLACLAVVLIAGCGKPVPPEKSAYVGEWQQKTMYLLITKDGRVKYRRVEGNQSTEIDGPIKDFSGDNFEVGVWKMSTMFVVNRPPYQENGRWRMVVDGVALTKTSN